MKSLWCAVLAVVAIAPCTIAEPLGQLAEVPLSQMGEKGISPLGRSALAIRSDWKHAQTENFVYHYFQSFIATPVSVEAEAYRRFNVQEFAGSKPRHPNKCHIYIFEQDADWQKFKGLAQLDPWTGGAIIGDELFIQRDPARKWKGDTLAHEVAHLVVHQYFGTELPLWLNEGFADYSATRAYSSFHRARGYSSRPRANAIAPADYIPVRTLISIKRYPADARAAGTLYDESQKLVRFLAKNSKETLIRLFAAGPKCNEIFEEVVRSQFADTNVFEQRFKQYATEDHGTSLQD
jgi:hypothetical protein